MQMALVGGLRRLDEQLAAHPEVQQQRAAVTVGTGEHEPEVLPTAAGINDLGATHPRDEVVGAGSVAAGDPSAGQLDVSDRAADHVGGQALANHLIRGGSGMCSNPRNRQGAASTSTWGCALSLGIGAFPTGGELIERNRRGRAVGFLLAAAGTLAEDLARHDDRAATKLFS